jgi:O-antigen/teichoic acid export membrane protein
MGSQAVAFVLLARSLGVDQFGALAATLATANLIAPLVEYGANNLVVRDIVAGIPTHRTVGLGLALSVVVLPLGLLMLALVKLMLLPQIAWGVLLAIGMTVFFGNRMTLLASGTHVAHGMQWRNTVLDTLNGTSLLALAVIFSQGATRLETWSQGATRLETWVVWSLLQSLTLGILALTWVARTWGRFTWTSTELRERFGQGIHFAINGAATNTYADLDKALLARFSTLEATGVFTAAHRLVVLGAVPLAAFLGAIYPRFFSSGQHGLTEARKFAWRVLPATFSYGLIATAIVWLLAPWFASLLGEGYADTTAAIRWLCWFILLQCIQLPFMEALTGSGHQKTRTLGQVIALVINAGLNLALIPQLGWRGSAFAALSGLVFLTAYVIWRCYNPSPDRGQARTAHET